MSKHEVKDLMQENLLIFLFKNEGFRFQFIKILWNYGLLKSFNVNLSVDFNVLHWKKYAKVSLYYLHVDACV